ncbi:MAG: gliding motility-associated ABC transporter substrate-binding protein GldG [Flavobacteriales bacterium]|nr:gliding motility-associated ABC transporter substrate-binding protein GldG [Flavobacteriales bacterium]
MDSTVKSTRYRDLIELGIGIGIVLLVLFIGGFARLRLDLTSEQRYTLKPATKDLAGGLQDVVFVKVYLHGELPADLQRLNQAVRDLLDELRVHAPDNIQYEFSDPNAQPDEKTRREVYARLEQEGLHYSSIRMRDKGSFTERIVFPGAMVTYRGRSVPLQLLKTWMRAPDAEMVNRSINNLEYELANAIRQATAERKRRVAFVEGHGELDDWYVKDITKVLSEQYDVSRVRIDEQLNSLSDMPEGMAARINKFDALIIAKPDSAIPKRDQYIIDQFIMNGGRVLWLLDAMNAHLDSLRKNQFSIATPLETDLDDMLFGYGIRVNKDILIDKNCAPIEIFTTPYGNQRKLERFPWYYEPVVVPRSGHPIVHSIDPVHLRFSSTIDTIGTDSVRKTVLLTSSPYSRALRNPVRVSLGIVETDMGLERSTTPDLPVAVLLEGRFRSAFADLLLVRPDTLRQWGYREWSTPTAQLFISDGDVIANRVDREKGMFYMLGYDRMAKTKIYGNRELILNAMNYLLDDQGLISIRAREITLRLLDPSRIAKDRPFWQLMNVAGPVLLVILAVTSVAGLRRRRWARAA